MSSTTMIIKFISTNGYKITYEDLNKDDTIDKLKLRIYREHSDHLPIPSNIFLDAGDSKSDGGDDSTTSEKDDSMHNNLKPSIIHPFQIRLLYGGKQLNNYSTLEENSIKSEDTMVIAVSPFYSLKKELENNSKSKVNDDYQSSRTTTTDELIVSNVAGKTNFTLAVNDHSAFETQKFSVLESLSDAESNLLFTRVKSDSKPTTTTNNNNNNNNNSFSQLIQSNNKFKIVKDTQSLETVMDRLTLEKKPDINRVEIVQSPLSIVTFTPTGRIDTAYRISIVFNRSFIPIGNDKEKCPIPFSITPEVPNAKWIWVDGVTCTYTTPNNTPFPRSTQYQVRTIPEIFTNFYNETFELKTWEISTSLQYLTCPYFNDNILNPQVLLKFSQKLPKEFLEKKRLSEYFSFTLDMEELHFEIIKDFEKMDKKIISQLEQPNIIPDDTLIFQISLTDIESIPNNSYIDIQVLSGIPSAEGPLKTTTILTNTFNTPPSFTLTPNTKYLDSYAKNVSFSCSAGSIIKQIDFKNLTENQIQEYVQIKPNVQITNINCHGVGVNIFADFNFLTTYQVTVKNFQDQNSVIAPTTFGNFPFGAEPMEFKLTTGYSDSYLFNLDPLSKPIIQFSSKGLDQIQLKVFKPNNLSLYKILNATKEKINDVTKEISSATIKINYQVRENTTTLVDLSKYFGSESSDKVVNPLLFFIFTYGKTQVGKWIQYSPFVPNVISYGNDISLWMNNAITNEKELDFNVDTYNNSSYGITPDAVVNYKSSSNGLVLIKNCDKQFQALSFKTSKSTISTVFKFTYSPSSIEKKVEWQTLDECGYYKPGDQVSIKGIVRFRDPVNSDISFPPVNELIKYKVIDPRRIEKLTGQTKLDEFGCFTISFTLPMDTNLGTISVNLTGPKESVSTHSFQLQEFKLKQFLVESKAEHNESPHIMENDKFSVQVYAKSYTDEILSNTLVDWVVSLSPTNPMTLPSGYDFKFDESDSEPVGGPYKFSSKRIISGRHKMDFVLQDMKSSYKVTVAGTIKDVTNVSESFSHQFMVYNKLLFLGVGKTSQTYINIDENFKTTLLVSDALGALSNRGLIKIQFKKVPWEEDLPLQLVDERDISPSLDSPVDFIYKFNSTGYYKIFISYKNPDAPDSMEQVFQKDLFVLGAQSEVEKEYKEIQPPVSLFKPLQSLYSNKPSLDLKILINNSQDSYSPGDSLDLVITSTKIQSGSGFLFICNNLRQTEQIPITLQEGSTKLQYIIKPSDFPLISFRVFVQGLVKMQINDQPVTRISSQFASTTTKLSLDSKKLSVEVNFKKFQTPGETSKFSVLVKNKNSQKTVPNALVTLAIVDEALIDISKKSISDWDPLDSFYPQQPGSSQSYSLLDNTIYQDPKTQKDVVPMDVVVTPQENQITIKYFSGRFIIFKVTNEISIEELRKLIQERDGLPPSYQRLFYQKKPITESDNLKTLKDFGVPNGSQLNLVIRLSGGSGQGNDDKPDPVVPQKIIRLRENFQSVAYFGSRATSENGLVDFECKLPDNLSSYKIMAYASTLGEFGSSEDTFTSTLPVMVRPSAPRFLNYNDECVFPISIQSIVNINLDVNIAIDSTTCKVEQSGFKGKLKPFGRLTVPCKVKALVPGHTTAFRCVVQTLTESGEELTDAINFKFPIASPTSSEGMTINHNLVDSSKEYSSHPIQFSNISELDQQVGGLKLNLSMSPLSKVRSCIDSLLSYEYSCSEQISSKLLPLSIIIANPKLFDSNTVEQLKKEKDDTISKMIEKLKLRYESKTHTFRYWDSFDSKSYEYVNLYVYWVLDIISKFSLQNFHEVKFIDDAHNTYINGILSNFSMSQYKKEKKSYLLKMAFACFVSRNTTKATEVAKKILKIATTDYPNDYVDVLAYIIRYVKDSKEVSTITNHITITGTIAYINGSNIDGFMSVSRSNAVAIISLLEIQPTHKLLPKLVGGLSKGFNMDSYNTQDNAFALYAMYLYQKSLNDKSTKTNFNVFLNQFQLDGPKELTLDKQELTLELPMSVLLKNQGQLFIEKLGKSNLFYNINLQYGMKKPFYKEISDRGLSIKRTYLSVQNTSDVTYSDQLIDNNNVVKIKAGSKVKVQLEINVRDVSTFIVIRDFLPSGLEPTLQNRKSYWMDHINIRDKGCEAFADYIYPGKYVFSYLTNALTFGTFIAPPARLEEMYCCSTFGRSKSEIIIIE